MLRILVLLSCVFHCCYSSFPAEELQNFSEIQKFQQEFDGEYFEIDEGFAKLRHILLHLVKTTGKMATYCEAIEHGKDYDSSSVINEVLPDLLIHALQVANHFNINLEEKYFERIQFIANRAALNQKESAKSSIIGTVPN